jgi:hypothetical protein
MKIIVDTCVWSLALRRHKPEQHPSTKELQNLIDDVRVQMIGPIRQELLTGIPSLKQYNQLKEYLNSFLDLTIETIDYEQAAEFSNKSREKGIQGSSVDFLICAIAYRHQMPIFTVDNDFFNYGRIIPIDLYGNKRVN